MISHGHLMLYDDMEQLEVRYVISLAHHDVSIQGVDDNIPEGELWIKRNAICLTRKPFDPALQTSKASTAPFYLFSDNLSDKEDFYFAIVNNMEKTADVSNNPPSPEHFETDHMVALVRRLHSSEEHLQTRWINALIGRVFLAVYKTEWLEDLIWNKLSKKIARVKKPNFITQLAIQKIDAGNGAPFITNPRLKDLTVEGDCCVEADIDYSGNFRLQVAATARIDLGTRFKPRDVELVLAVVLKKLKGHVLFRLKPPPSNRIWISFVSMPAMEMALEPIVSSRQITYGIILRAIESRIREVVAETLVQPFWDDIPFFDTASQSFRGGIWHRTAQPSRNTIIPDEAEEAHPPAAPISVSVASGRHGEESYQPQTPSSPNRSSVGLGQSDGSDNLPSDITPTSSQDKILRPEQVRASRTGSLTSTSNTVLTPLSTNTDTSLRDDKSRDLDAASQNSRMSGNSQPASPTTSSGDLKSVQGGTPQSESFPNLSSTKGLGEGSGGARQRAMTSSSNASSAPLTPSEKSFTSPHHHTDTLQPDPEAESQKSPGGPNKILDKRAAINAIGTAAATAKKWGLTVFTRPDQVTKKENDRPARDQPMGRGRPLPPPGTPLPPPDDSTFFRSKPITMPKRKPVPPPLLPERFISTSPESPRPVPKPPLPKRRSVQRITGESPVEDEVLVIQAPDGSEPSSPVQAEAFGSGSGQESDADGVRYSQSFDSSVDLRKKLE